MALPLAGAAQTLPQAPQFSGSFEVSTQPDSHSENAQSTTHSPLLQLATPLPGAAQTLPHAPQLLLDESRSTHVPPHGTRPAGHSSLHAPSTQTLPSTQR
jgi:hypothetical protein